MCTGRLRCGHLSAKCPWRLERSSFTGDSERQVKEGSGNGASLSEGNPEVDSFTGDSEKHVREGSFSKDFETFVVDGSGNRAFFFVGALNGEPNGTLQGWAHPMCLLGWNLYLIYSAVMFNLTGFVAVFLATVLLASICLCLTL
jgi:hypothetical protein